MVYAGWVAAVQDQQGNIRPGAMVEVRNINTGALAVLFSNREATIGRGNPFPVNADGYAIFFAQGGEYSVRAYQGAFETEWPYVAIGTTQGIDIEDLTLGSNVNAQVNTLPERAIYDGEEPGFVVMVSNVGDGRAAIYTKTDTGWTDPAYVTGPQGIPGPSTVLSVGTVETVDYGEGSSATLTGSSPAQVLNLELERGAPGRIDNFQGSWVPGEEYASGDLVEYGGSGWMAMVANPDGPPPGAGWELFVQGGSVADGTVTLAKTDGTFATITARDVPELLSGVVAGKEISYTDGPDKLVVVPGQSLVAAPFDFSVHDQDEPNPQVVTDSGVKLFTILTQHKRLTARQFGCTESSLDDALRLRRGIEEAGFVGVPFVLDGNYRSGAQINTIADTVIEFVPGASSLTMVEDHQIGINSDGFRLEIHNPRVIDIVPVGSRTIPNGNRAIRANGGPGLHIIGDGYYEGFYNAVHALGCEWLVATGYHLVKDALGAAAQQGYGFNDSARHSVLGAIVGDNRAQVLGSPNGRHVLYINGPLVTSCTVGYVRAENYYLNPVNINLNGADRKGFILIEAIDFRDVNFRPAATSTLGGGTCVTLLQDTGQMVRGVKVDINSLRIDGYDGGVLTIVGGGYDYSSVKNVLATRKFNDPAAASTNQRTIYVANSKRPVFENVFVEALGHANDDVIFLNTGVEGAVISNVETLSTGDAVLRVGSSVTGNIKVDGLAGPTGMRPLRHDGGAASYNLKAKTDWVTVDTSSPNVGGLANIQTTRTTNLTIGNFVGGVPGQVITIFALNGNTTIQNNGTNIETKTLANLALGPRQSAMFQLSENGTRWVQIPST